eukprot:GFUD01022920.1.p1 GENE.GFUD01022920.1~~GFUD01022920.1.p1  ORF type:complete len:327 (-),score=79.69 GFUD01022920.1:37-1017(-)
MHVPSYLLALVAVQLQVVPLQAGTEYHCEYLAAHRDLVCQCQRYTMTISSLSSLIAKYPGRVESIKLHLCQSLDLTISTVDIQQPFYQLRIEDIDQVTLHGVELGHGHALDILVRNVRDHLNMVGRIECSDCPKLQSNSSMDVRLSAKPTLIMQVKDTTQATIQYMDITSVNFRLKTRNVENIKIVNSQVDKMTKNAVELFYSQRLDISNSIFKHVEEAAMIINHVDRVEVTHTLGFNNRSLQLLSNKTEVVFSCTAPYDGIMGPLYSWEEEKCGPVSVLLYQGKEKGKGGGTGAVILTISCVGVLIIVMLVVIFMHRRGKLDILL